MKKREKNKSEETCVLLWEEYGYRIYIWYPEMTPLALIEWWRNCESLPRIRSLPGRVIVVTGKGAEKHQRYSDIQKSGAAFEAHIHMDEDSHLKTPQGEYVYDKGLLLREAEEEKRRRR